MKKLSLLCLLALPGYANFDEAFTKAFPDVAVESRFKSMHWKKKCETLQSALNNSNVSDEQKTVIIDERVLPLLDDWGTDYRGQLKPEPEGLLKHVGLETIIRFGTLKELKKCKTSWLEKDFPAILTLVQTDAVLCRKLLSVLSPRCVASVLRRLGLGYFLKYEGMLHNFIVSGHFPWHCITDDLYPIYVSPIHTALAEHLECNPLTVAALLGKEEYSYPAEYFITTFLLKHMSISALQNTIFPHAKQFFCRKIFAQAILDEDDRYASWYNSCRRIRSKYHDLDLPELSGEDINREKFWECVRSAPEMLKFVVHSMMEAFIKDSLGQSQKIPKLFIDSTAHTEDKYSKQALKVILKECPLPYIQEVVPEFWSSLSMAQLLGVDYGKSEAITCAVNAALTSRENSKTEVLDFFKSKDKFSVGVLEKVLTFFPKIVEEIFDLETKTNDYRNISRALFCGAQKLLIETLGPEILHRIAPSALLRFFSYDIALKMESGGKTIEQVERIISKWWSSWEDVDHQEASFFKEALENKGFFFNVCRNIPEFVKRHWDWKTCFEAKNFHVLSILRDDRVMPLTQDLLDTVDVRELNDAFKKNLIKVFSLERLVECKNFTIIQGLAVALRKKGLLSEREVWTIMQRMNTPVDWEKLNIAVKGNLGHREGIQGSDLARILEPLALLFLQDIPSDSTQDTRFAQATQRVEAWIHDVGERFGYKNPSWINGLDYMHRAKERDSKKQELSIAQVFAAAVSVADRAARASILLKALTDVFVFPGSTQNFLNIPNVSYARLNSVLDLKPYEFIDAGEHASLKRKNKALLTRFMRDLEAGAVPMKAHPDGYAALMHTAGHRMQKQILDALQFPETFLTQADVESPYHPISTVLRLCESVIFDGNGGSIWSKYPRARCLHGVWVDSMLSIASMLGQEDAQHLSSTLFKNLDCAAT